ncbi:MAG: AbrB family transcriptional regulator [Dehalococcoidia bacterium]|nr:AbrB family transcriptional regulator [Dehalococcoidia bacterium]
MPSTVGSKGQVVIEKKLRDRLGVEPGWTAIQRLVDDHIEIYFVPPPHRRSLRGIFKSDIQVSDDEWHEVKAQAWRAAAEERVRRMAEDEEGWRRQNEAR